MPLVGRIAAGGPILAEQTIDDVFPLPRELVGEGTLFLLNVKGDSMIDAAICDGDWVVVRQQPNAENGDIVAAMIDGDATVKTYRLRDGHVTLMPHNPRLRADSRRQRDHPRQGRGGPPPDLSAVRHLDPGRRYRQNDLAKRASDTNATDRAAFWGVLGPWQFVDNQS